MSVRISNRESACEKLRLSVLALFLGFLLLLTGRAAQPLLYPIGTDLALAPSISILMLVQLAHGDYMPVAAIALTPYEDRETAASLRAPTELLQTEMVAE